MLLLLVKQWKSFKLQQVVRVYVKLIKDLFAF